MKVKLLSLVLVGLLCTLAISPTMAFAGSWSPSIGWSSAAGSYSPDRGNTSFYEYTDSSGNLKLSPKVRFDFDQAIVVNIQAMYGLYGAGYYYTMDIAVPDSNTSVSAYGSCYSTLPSPHFDLDDDNGDGKYDEAEVTCEDPFSLATNTDYRFEAYYNVYNQNPALFHFTSQKSYWSDLYHEYNVMSFETHVTRWYPW